MYVQPSWVVALYWTKGAGSTRGPRMSLCGSRKETASSGRHHSGKARQSSPAKGVPCQRTRIRRALFCHRQQMRRVAMRATGVAARPAGARTRSCSSRSDRPGRRRWRRSPRRRRSALAARCDGRALCSRWPAGRSTESGAGSPKMSDADSATESPEARLRRCPPRSRRCLAGSGRPGRPCPPPRAASREREPGAGESPAAQWDNCSSPDPGVRHDDGVGRSGRVRRGLGLAAWPCRVGACRAGFRASV